MSPTAVVKAARSVLAACGAALVASACQFSFGGGLDYEKLEKAITDELNSSYSSIDQQVSNVECPEQSPDPGTGDTFDCTAEVGGQTVRVASTITDDDYNVDFSTRDTLYDLQDTATALTDDLSNQLGFAVTVDCGDGLKAVEIGTTFDCVAADGQGEERTVRITAAPVGENDSWELLE
ncbi:DUF4333 domain-containing protein [Mycobacterium sp. NAZ190054]|uniref:DUF4333 domain-containing protein n=1 Tax=Mycobacterium sp. NAZ190054 TaxID=1747766 RepID=UPI000799DF66|nr:DUF4333 domain-containing protein [Mycobacterium sp. NAZ190054]KWX57237.1 hypothetical protein ASJ79_12115 [Mycobacterium sp. NAZ190054]